MSHDVCAICGQEKPVCCDDGCDRDGWSINPRCPDCCDGRAHGRPPGAQPVKRQQIIIAYSLAPSLFVNLKIAEQIGPVTWQGQPTVDELLKAGWRLMSIPPECARAPVVEPNFKQWRWWFVKEE